MPAEIGPLLTKLVGSPCILAFESLHDNVGSAARLCLSSLAQALAQTTACLFNLLFSTVMFDRIADSVFLP